MLLKFSGKASKLVVIFSRGALHNDVVLFHQLLYVSDLNSATTCLRAAPLGTSKALFCRCL